MKYEALSKNSFDPLTKLGLKFKVQRHFLIILELMTDSQTAFQVSYLVDA